MADLRNVSDRGIPPGQKEYATILAFDVRIDPEARAYADEVCGHLVRP